MTQAQFDSLKPGDVIQNVADAVPFTVKRRTPAGFELAYPGPVKVRFGSALTASKWRKL